MAISKNITAHLAVFTVSCIYGANFIFAKDVLSQGYISPAAFILMRVFAGTILFWLFHWLYIKEKIERKDIGILIAGGFFGTAINMLFFFKGLAITNHINAALIITLTPIVVYLITLVLGMEKITSLKVGGLVFGITGAIIVIGPFGGTGINLGDIYVLINALAYGTYLVIVKRLMSKYHPITVVKWVFLFGLFFVFPMGISDLAEVTWSSFPNYIWFSVIYVLIFTTFVAYLFNAFALNKLQASTVSSYIYLQPLIATILATLLGKDQITVPLIIATILIFIGVFMISRHHNS